MTARNVKNVAASVHQRLLNIARQTNRPFSELLQYYAIERFLFRLSQSAYADRFVLKGALTLLVWKMPATRPTRDIDLLGRIDNDVDAIRAVFATICRQTVEADGLDFNAEGVATSRIAEDADYHGVRVRFQGHLRTARVPMQIDIGFSDVITPAPVRVTYPTVLDHAPATLNAYNRETIVAEKFEAMIKLGALNSRMKDFFDVWALSQHFDFDGRDLSAAIRQTFERRATSIVADPVCFTPDFANDDAKAKQWTAFLRNGQIKDAPARFADVLDRVKTFLAPLTPRLTAGTAVGDRWPRGGPWENRL